MRLPRLPTPMSGCIDGHWMGLGAHDALACAAATASGAFCVGQRMLAGRLRPGCSGAGAERRPGGGLLDKTMLPEPDDRGWSMTAAGRRALRLHQSSHPCAAPRLPGRLLGPSVYSRGHVHSTLLSSSLARRVFCQSAPGRSAVDPGSPAAPASAPTPGSTRPPERVRLLSLLHHCALRVLQCPFASPPLHSRCLPLPVTAPALTAATRSAPSRAVPPFQSRLPCSFPRSPRRSFPSSRQHGLLAGLPSPLARRPCRRLPRLAVRRPEAKVHRGVHHLGQQWHVSRHPRGFVVRPHHRGRHMPCASVPSVHHPPLADVSYSPARRATS